MTQKEILETVLLELGKIKSTMPNGELKIMQEDMKELKEDLSDLKRTLLNPEDGVIVKTNQNTWFRKSMEPVLAERDDNLRDFEELKRWKDNVSRALWVMFTVLAGLIAKILFSHPL